MRASLCKARTRVVSEKIQKGINLEFSQLQTFKHLNIWSVWTISSFESPSFDWFTSVGKIMEMRRQKPIWKTCSEVSQTALPEFRSKEWVGGNIIKSEFHWKAFRGFQVLSVTEIQWPPNRAIAQIYWLGGKAKNILIINWRSGPCKFIN